MRRNKILSSIIAALIIIMSLVGSVSAEASQNKLPLEGTLIVLHTNDMHGHAITDFANGYLGYAVVAQVKKDYEALGASVLLLDAGDASQGMPLVNLSYGKSAFEFMNIARYDAMSPGNHEFDWGYDNLKQNTEIAEFAILAANIRDKITGDLVFEANKIFDTKAGKIGVFGLATPETMTKTHPDKTRSIVFMAGDAMIAAAQEQVDLLKAEGCDFIIALGHLGIADESVGNQSVDVLNNVTGIDLFIDGHSHSIIEGQKIGGATLVSTGEHGKKLGIVTWDGETIATSLYEGVAADVKELVIETNAQAAEILAQAFATTEVLLNGERDPGVRTEETNLGDFAADSILYAAKKAVGDDVVAAITNGGGIRASIAIGDITMNDMKTVFPFGNTVSVITVTGAELLEVLEAGTFSTPDAIGAFPQVAGIEFTIDTTVPFEQGEAYPESTYFKPANPGARVTITTVGGEAFDLEATYKIATNDFLAAGGDTYYAFRFANATSGIDTGIALEDALIDYVANALDGVVGQEYAKPAGRITVVK